MAKVSISAITVSYNGTIPAIPEHRGVKSDHLALVTSFEIEHIVLAWNSADEYERTKTHGIGTGHPIIAECRTLKR